MNQMNPLKLLQLKTSWDQFKLRHPKFPAFITSVMNGAITEDAIIEISITAADGRTINSNLKVTAEDIQMVEDLKELLSGQ